LGGVGRRHCRCLSACAECRPRPPPQRVEAMLPRVLACAQGDPAAAARQARAAAADQELEAARDARQAEHAAALVVAAEAIRREEGPAVLADMQEQARSCFWLPPFLAPWLPALSADQPSTGRSRQANAGLGLLPCLNPTTRPRHPGAAVPVVRAEPWPARRGAALPAQRGGGRRRRGAAGRGRAAGSRGPRGEEKEAPSRRRQAAGRRKAEKCAPVAGAAGLAACACAGRAGRRVITYTRFYAMHTLCHAACRWDAPHAPGLLARPEASLG
jgi:hypothetical protein